MSGVPSMKTKPRADEKTRLVAFDLLQGRIGAHHTSQRVAVSNANGGIARAVPLVSTNSLGCDAPRRNE